VNVGFLAHPTMVTDDELAAITGPLSIAAAETDPIFPAENRHRSEGILQKTGQPYHISLFSGVAHGFGLRADLSKKDQRFAQEQAILQALAWFSQYL